MAQTRRTCANHASPPPRSPQHRARNPRLPPRPPPPRPRRPRSALRRRMSSAPGRPAEQRPQPAAAPLEALPSPPRPPRDPRPPPRSASRRPQPAPPAPQGTCIRWCRRMGSRSARTASLAPISSANLSSYATHQPHPNRQQALRRGNFSRKAWFEPKISCKKIRVGNQNERGQKGKKAGERCLESGNRLFSTPALKNKGKRNVRRTC